MWCQEKVMNERSPLVNKLEVGFFVSVLNNQMEQPGLDFAGRVVSHRGKSAR